MFDLQNHYYWGCVWFLGVSAYVYLCEGIINKNIFLFTDAGRCFIIHYYTHYAEIIFFVCKPFQCFILPRFL